MGAYPWGVLPQFQTSSSPSTSPTPMFYFNLQFSPVSESTNMLSTPDARPGRSMYGSVDLGKEHATVERIDNNIAL